MKKQDKYNFLPKSYENEIKIKEKKKLIILIGITIMFAMSTVLNLAYKRNNMYEMYERQSKIKSDIYKQKAYYKSQNKFNFILDIVSEYIKNKVPFNAINISNNYVSIRGVASISQYKNLLNDLENKRKFKITNLKYPNKNNNYNYEVEVYINRK